MNRLPIDDVLGELLTALRGHGAAVLVAPPGAGKTTRVPPAILDAGLAGEGRVVVLQPRRVAARASARRIAEERGAALGGEVGYRIRFEDRTGPTTRIEVLTEGLLTRRLQGDPFLEGVGCVVLDELHERSLHADLGLALLREVRREARPDLRLVAMSATLDPGPVAAFLECPVVVAEGRTFPVEVAYDPLPDDRPLPQRCAAAARAELARALSSDLGAGHVLVFLPGVGEIERTAEALGPLAEADVLPLHGSLPGEAQDRALAPSPRPKVVLATNIAETSVTLEGVRAVVDSGLARVPRFDPAVGLERLESVRISRASADQRAGRAGRTGPGRCRRLWTESEQQGLRPAERPEVRRLDLTRAVLEIRGWGADPLTFEWFEAPEPETLARADGLLRRLGALSADGVVTDLGRTLLALPLHPRLGRVVVAGHRAGCLADAATVAALVAERDIFAEPPDQAGDSDLLLRLDALRDLERGHPWPGLNRRAAREVLRARDQLTAVARRELGAGPPRKAGSARGADDEALLRILLTGFPDRVAHRRAPRSERFLMASGSGAVLDPRSVVMDADLVLAVGLEGGRRGVRAEHVIRVASALDPRWLDVETEIVTRFDPAREAVVQQRVRRFLALELDAAPAGEDADPDAVAAALARAVCLDPARALAFDRDVEAWLARLRWLAAEAPELDLPTFGELAPAETPGPLIEALCQGRRSFAELRRVDLLPMLKGLAGHAVTSAVDRLAPDRLTLPDGTTRRLEYTAGAPPVLAARIQQLFGLQETPAVAGGRVPVMLHLLAPSQRPVQITRDLRSFWRTTYAEVRKELRGRYPKHDWPEDPLTATARPRRQRSRE